MRKRENYKNRHRKETGGQKYRLAKWTKRKPEN